jgi:beta-phosphoglucomutase
VANAMCGNELLESEPDKLFRWAISLRLHMALQAVLFDFNGTIINDEPIHRQLIDELLLSANLRPAAKSYRKTCLGQSDRHCLLDLFAEQGRSITDLQLHKILVRKAQAYQQRLAEMAELPIYPDLIDFLDQLQAADIKLGIVTGALRLEVETVLQQSGLIDRFTVIVAAEDVPISKPAPAGYLLAVAQLQLRPPECLAIEDTFPGIKAAQSAHIPVVGIAHTYPFHMMQRRADWAVDCFADVELPRIQDTYKK